MGKVFTGWVVLGLTLIASAETTLAWKFDTSGRTEVVPAKAEKAFTSSTGM